MPDDDRIPRSLSGRWRRSLKAFLAGEPQEDIEFHVARATAWESWEQVMRALGPARYGRTVAL